MRDIPSEIAAERTARLKELESRSERRGLLAYLLNSISGFFSRSVKEASEATYKARVLNFPTTQKVEGKVEVLGLPEVKTALYDVIEATRANQIALPDVQAISGSVSVDNFPEPKEIKIPEYPKQIKTDVTSLPKYVSEKLDEIKKAVKEIEVRPQVNVQEREIPKTEIDLTPLEKKIDTLASLLTSLNEKPDVETDLTPLISAVSEVKVAVDGIRFPVPNFRSSWSQSFTMQAEDLDQTFGYTSNDPENADYIDVTALDGKTYRRTLTYGTVGGVKVCTKKSKWTEV